MAPKKVKSPHKKNVKEDNLLELPGEDWLEKDLDLVKDLNYEFFDSFTTRIEYLARNQRIRDASHMKKVSDLLYHLHRNYVASLKENNILRPQIQQTNERFRLAIELTGNNAEAIDFLKKDIARAWNETDIAQHREGKVQKTLQELIVKCDVSATKDNEEEEDAKLGRLSQYKNVILRERDRLSADNADMEKRLQLLRFYVEGLEVTNKDLEETNAKAAMRSQNLLGEKNALDIKNKALVMALEEQKILNSKLSTKLHDTASELQSLYVKFTEKSTTLDKQKIQIDVIQTDNATLSRLLKKQEIALVMQAKKRRDLESMIQAQKNENKLHSDVIVTLTRDLKKAAKQHSLLSNKLYKMDHLNNMLGDDISKQKNIMSGLEKDLLNSIARYRELNRLKDSVIRERDHLRSDIAKMNNTMGDLRHTLALQGFEIENYKGDIHRLRMKVEENDHQIKRLEKERNSLNEDVLAYQKQIEDYEDDLKMKRDTITELSENLEKNVMKLNRANKNLEALHSQKALLQRDLDARIQDRDKLRKIQSLNSYEISQLTTEVSNNQRSMNSLNLRMEHLNTAKKEVENALRNTQNILSSTRDDLKETKTKNMSLIRTLQDDEKRFISITAELDNTTKEKNLVGLQMVRRNDEIVALSDKMHLMQTAVDRGQMEYNRSINDIALLKCAIKTLQLERDSLVRAARSTASMRNEIVRLNRTLNQERIKVRALLEDIRTPNAIHRWRILKGTDPNKFELIRKITMMQRRNMKLEIQKTNLQEQLNLANENCDVLKKALNDMPTSDVKVKYAESQRILREQKKQLKILSAELTVTGIDVTARDCVIEGFKTTLKITQDTLRKQIQLKTCCTREAGGRRIQNGTVTEISSET